MASSAPPASVAAGCPAPVALWRPLGERLQRVLRLYCSLKLWRSGVCGALACALLVLLRSLLSVLGCRGFSLRVYVFSVHPLGCTCGSSHGTISSAAAMDDAALEDAQQHTARTLKALQNRSRVSRTERVLTKQAQHELGNNIKPTTTYPNTLGAQHHCLPAQHNPRRAGCTQASNNNPTEVSNLTFAGHATMLQVNVARLHILNNAHPESLHPDREPYWGPHCFITRRRRTR